MSSKGQCTSTTLYLIIYLQKHFLVKVMAFLRKLACVCVQERSNWNESNACVWTLLHFLRDFTIFHLYLCFPARFLSVLSLITSSTYFYCKQAEFETFWWVNQLSTDLNILIVHFAIGCFCCLMVWLLKSGSSLAGSRWTWPVINIKCYSRTHSTFLIWHTFWLKQNIQSGKNVGQDLILSSGNWLDHEQWAFCSRLEPEVNTSLQLIVYSSSPS